MSFLPISYKVGFRPVQKNEPFFESLDLRNFSFLPNRLLYWFADPFVFEYQGKNYVIAEMCNKITAKGMIAYTCLDDKKKKWTKCLKEPFHLSFPNLSIQGDSIYLTPETHQAKSIFVYESHNLYFGAKKTSILFGKDFVDSVFYNDAGKSLLFSYSDKTLFVYQKIGTKFDLVKSIPDTGNLLRPAGKIFEFNGRVIFPTQDGNQYYGSGVVFNDFDPVSLTINKFSEINFKDCNRFYKTKRICGIHTYNSDSNYEVIDVTFFSPTFFGFLGKGFRLVKKLFKPKSHKRDRGN